VDRSGQIDGADLDHRTMVVLKESLGSFVIDIEGNRLDGAFNDDDGERKDYFTILKGGNGVNT